MELAELKQLEEKLKLVFFPVDEYLISHRTNFPLFRNDVKALQKYDPESMKESRKRSIKHIEDANRWTGKITIKICFTFKKRVILYNLIRFEIKVVD